MSTGIGTRSCGSEWHLKKKKWLWWLLFLFFGFFGVLVVVLVVTIRFTSEGVLQHQIFVYTYKTFKHLFIYVRLVFSISFV